MLKSFHSLTWPLHQVCMGKCFTIQYQEKKIFSIIFFFLIVFLSINFDWFWLMSNYCTDVIVHYKVLCFFFLFVIALMLCNRVWFLDVIEPLFLALLLLCQFVMHWCCCALDVEPLVLALMLLCLCIVALMLLCKMYVLVLRVLEPVVWHWCCYAIRILRCFESTGNSCISLLQF